MKQKKLFFETKNRNFWSQFKRYKEACQDKGGIFFLIFRGKYSEGLDFKNELARMVIIMGIPFSNMIDFNLKAKKEYFEE